MYYRYNNNYNKFLVLAVIFLLWNDNIENQNKCLYSNCSNNLANRLLTNNKSCTSYYNDSVNHKSNIQKFKSLKNHPRNILNDDFNIGAKSIDIHSLDNIKQKHNETEVFVNNVDLGCDCAIAISTLNTDPLDIINVKEFYLIQSFNVFKKNNKNFDSIVSIMPLSYDCTMAIDNPNINPPSIIDISPSDIVQSFNDFKQTNKNVDTTVTRNSLCSNSNIYQDITKTKQAEFMESFRKLLLESLGKTVTIFVTGGGKHGLGFTGVILYVDDCLIKLITQVDKNEVSSTGNCITYIPLDKIVAFTHNNF